MNNLHEQLQELKNQNNLYIKEHKTFEEQLIQKYPSIDKMLWDL